MVERGTRAGNWLVRVALADALGLSPLEVLTPDEIPTYRLVTDALTLEQAELAVWGLEQAIAARDAGRPIAAPGGKVGAALAIRTVSKAHPDRKRHLESIRARLNELFG
jgi:hypothetical protein